MLALRNLLVLFMSVFILTINVHADEIPNENQASLMWTAFSCATYAEIIGNKDEQRRLFILGVDAGRKFIDGVTSEKINAAEINDAPVGVTLRMAGPSSDFIVGRIFEGASEYAYDKVVKEDMRGFPIFDPNKWARDEHKILRANNLYNSSNCSLIK